MRYFFLNIISLFDCYVIKGFSFKKYLRAYRILGRFVFFCSFVNYSFETPTLIFCARFLHWLWYCILFYCNFCSYVCFFATCKFFWWICQNWFFKDSTSSRILNVETCLAFFFFVRTLSYVICLNKSAVI